MPTSQRISVNKKGFTLVELLVVVTIIAILMAIGFIAYRQFVRQAEDAQRLSDLKFIQSALEQYHADQHYYPPTPSKDVAGQPFKNPDGSKTYLTTIPKDPGTTEYSYQGISCTDDQCKSYCLYARLNYPAGMQSDPECSPTAPYNLGVTRP